MLLGIGIGGLYLAGIIEAAKAKEAEAGTGTGTLLGDPRQVAGRGSPALRYQPGDWMAE